MGVTVMDAMKNALEPLRLRGAARCASRGIWPTFGVLACFVPLRDRSTEREVAFVEGARDQWT